MKRTLVFTILLAVMYMCTTVCIGETEILPEANCNKHIRLSGYTWYSDYHSVMDTARLKGMDSDSAIESFEFEEKKHSALDRSNGEFGCKWK